MNLKKIGKVFTSKIVGIGPSSYEKRIYRGRGLTKVEKHCQREFRLLEFLDNRHIRVVRLSELRNRPSPLQISLVDPGAMVCPKR